jgi:hypothetical protein
MTLSDFKIDWKGDMVDKKVREAVAWGIDSVMADCVVTAKSEHNWKNQTTVLQGSLMMQPAKDQGDAIIGLWGSFDVEYARWLELGTRFIPKGKYTWLVPASDKHYPSLSHRISAKLLWG